jgi:hypothetical protein
LPAGLPPLSHDSGPAAERFASGLYPATTSARSLAGGNQSPARGDGPDSDCDRHCQYRTATERTDQDDATQNQPHPTGHAKDSAGSVSLGNHESGAH